MELSHRLHQDVAVPQYHHERGYQWLLPLYITHDDHSKRPDLVTTLSEDQNRQVYIARTLLTPPMAYPNARSVCISRVQISSWVE